MAGGEVAVMVRVTGQRVSSPTLVGRDAELQSLVEAVTSPPAVAVVEGEAGIGKSRLVAELAARLENAAAKGKTPTPGRPLRVLVGRCHRVREPFPLGPVLEAVRGLGGELGRLGLSPLAGALRPLLPELADALPPGLEPLGDAAGERHRVFRALVEVLGAAGPAVLVVEDLHWSDPDQTPEFLRFVIDEQPPGLTVVVTFRGEEVTDEMRAAIARPPTESTSVRLALAPLDQAGTAQLTAAILDAGQVSDGFATYLHETTDGVPFAVEEMLALLRERGALTQHEGRWERQMLSSLGVPAAIAEAVAERVTRLSPEAQTLVEAAAVLETDAPDDVVVQVAGMDGAAATRAIAEAVAAGLLTDDGGLLGFRHVLAAQAVYVGLTSRQRRELHSRAADALAKTQPRPLGRLAHHLRHAGRLAEWASAAEQAADQASELGHDVEAVRLLEDVLCHAPVAPEDRGRLAVKLGRAVNETVHPRSELVELLSGVLEEDLPRGVRGELRFWLALMVEHTGGDPAAQRRLRSAAVADLDHRPDLQAWAMVSLGIWSAPGVPFCEDKAWLDRALEVVPRIEDRAFVVMILGKIAMVLVGVGDPAWRGVCERIEEETAGAPRQRREVNAFHSVAVTACYAGHYDVAHRLLGAAAEGATACESRALQRRVRLTRVFLDFCRGAWDGLDDAVAALLDEFADFPPLRVDAEAVAGLLALACGTVADAHHQLLSVVQQSEDWGDLDVRAYGIAALSRLAIAQGDVTEVLGMARRFLAGLESKGVWTPAVRALPGLTELMVNAGELGTARDLVARTSRELDGLDAPLASAALEYARGVLDCAAERWADAAEHFLAAAELYEPLQCPYEAAQAREQAGVALAEAGDARAEETLRAALTAYEHLGASWDAARCARAGRERGVSIPVPHRGGRVGYGNELSPREEEVVELAAEGCTNKEIAARLFISATTVDKHLGRAMRKLGVHSRRKLHARLNHAGPD